MTAPAADQGEESSRSEAGPGLGGRGGGGGSGIGRREERLQRREHRRRRFRRHGRRAYIRSVYFLPSMATLGNAICGFGAMYVAALAPDIHSNDRLTNFFSLHHF